MNCDDSETMDTIYLLYNYYFVIYSALHTKTKLLQNIESIHSVQKHLRWLRSNGLAVLLVDNMNGAIFSSGIN
jgi:hypothetical protein